MKQQSYGFKLMAAVLAAFTFVGTATAGKPLVPFKGQSSGVATTVGFDPELGVVSVHGEGQGEATHLGRFTLTADVSIYVLTPNFLVIGNWTYVAANGDKLFAHGIGSAGADPLQGVGSFTITGGTGRFKGASGSFQQVITFAFPGGAVPSNPYSEVLYNGTISYPAAE
jgi:hypothetical protein